MMTGITASCGSFCICASTSSPSISGIDRSSSTAEGRSCATLVSASRPFTAVETT